MKLLKRPIAVFMSLLAIVIVGIIAAGKIPVSLMPNVEIPQISIQFSAPGMSAREIDESVMKGLRTRVIQIPGLEDVKCESFSGSGKISLVFNQKYDIDLGYIEVNEKVAQFFQTMPRELGQPKVVKASLTDVPVCFVEMTIPESTNDKFVQLSRLAVDVVARRIEQIASVAAVDVSGTTDTQITVTPNYEKLVSLGIDTKDLEGVIYRNNVNFGSLTVKDGHYQWPVRFQSELRSAEDILNLFLKINGKMYQMSDLVEVSEEEVTSSGIIRTTNGRAVVLAIIKKSNAQMRTLKKELNKTIEALAKDYPLVRFDMARNQTELLDYSIGNLRANIILAIVLVVIVLLFFMRDFSSPVLVAVSIPISLIITLLALYLIGVSINIISLSGLILGVGMMVDNAIVVIDNIEQFINRGFSVQSACVYATKEVLTPLLSSVLTTCSVFIPLIFLGGIAGALFYDQALAVTMSLFSSLIVSVTVIPVFFFQMYRKEIRREKKKNTRKQIIKYEKIYERHITWAFRHQKSVWAAFAIMILGTVTLFLYLDKSKLPPVIQEDIIVHVDWNQPVSIAENERRANSIISGINGISQYEIMIGHQKFVLPHSGDISQTQALFYIKASTPDSLEFIKKAFTDKMKDYPKSVCAFDNSVNVFNIVFGEHQPDMVAKIKNPKGETPDVDNLYRIVGKLKEKEPGIDIVPIATENVIKLTVSQEKLAFYGVDYQAIYNVLQSVTKENTVMSINTGSFYIPIIFAHGGDSNKSLMSASVRNNDGVNIPLSYLLTEHKMTDLKGLVSGKEGGYYPLNLLLSNKHNVGRLLSSIKGVIYSFEGYSVGFSGAYFSSRALLKKMLFVLLLAILLLYFILAAQFESFIQPFIILSELVADIFGALLALWICGAGINIMSMIGIIVMCGIVINDSILKVDTINKLSKRHNLLRAILVGGKRRFKPIVMTSLTTILAVMPFLVGGSLGADLQKPLSIALIGGMIVGTGVSLYVVPVIYYEITRRKGK